MSKSQIGEVKKDVTLYFHNPHSGESLRSASAKYSFFEVNLLLSQLTYPGVYLITTMPSGLGLDFFSEEDGTVWIEFYGDVLQCTWVDVPAAQSILKRAYSSAYPLRIQELFSDLVEKWGY